MQQLFIVFGTQDSVPEDVIGVLDGLEALLGLHIARGVTIRMVEQRLLWPRIFDFVGSGLGGGEAGEGKKSARRVGENRFLLIEGEGANWGRRRPILTRIPTPRSR